MADSLERARIAYDAARWEASYEDLAAADAAQPLEPADLWRLALTAYLTGRDAAYTGALERAHHACMRSEDIGTAARCAFWLGFYLADRGEMGPATGWFQRAGRLLERAGCERVEHGYLLLPTAVGQLEGGDPAEAYRTAGAAVDLGERFGDADLHALAVHLQGRALLDQQRIEEGLALLDESMVGITAGEVSPLVTGLVYCSVIGACRRVYALDRSHEWTAALRVWCERQPDLVPYRGHCLIYRAEIMQLHGEWQEALEEAERVLAIPDRSGGSPAQRAAAGAAHYQIGEVHRLLGRHAEAEAAYRDASRFGKEPQPGLALLRLAQGERIAAGAAMHRALAESVAPPHRVRLLPAAVEIALALGDAEGARLASRELAEIAGTYGSRALEALAAHAAGSVALAVGEPLAALSALRKACHGWRKLDAPFEEARARVLIARACRLLRDGDAAALELEAARTCFARLGATQDLDQLAEEPVGVPSADPGSATRAHDLTARELEVLALVATGLTNRAVAERLFISEKTVARHVSNIFTKLGLSSRSAATAWAYEHELFQRS